MLLCLPDYSAAVTLENFDNFLVDCINHTISTFAFGDV